MNTIKALLLSGLLLALPCTEATVLPNQAHIAVTGHAVVRAKADTVRISFHSVAVEKDAEKAKRTVDEQVSNILSQMAGNGFEAALLTRSDIQLRPENEYVDNKRTQVGIRATRSLSYQLHDLSQLNIFLQIIVNEGISNVGDIHYGLQAPKQWQLTARELAVKDSINKATELAENYNASLGGVYSINYQQNSQEQPLLRAMKSNNSLPVYDSHQIEIKERVDVVFLLTP